MTDNLLDPKYPPHKTVEQMEAEMRGNLAKHDRLAMIARKHLNLETLETRNSDSADFSDQAVWNIRAALAAAYEAGKREAPESPAEWIMRQGRKGGEKGPGIHGQRFYRCRGPGYLEAPGNRSAGCGPDEPEVAPRRYRFRQALQALCQ